MKRLLTKKAIPARKSSIGFACKIDINSLFLRKQEIVKSLKLIPWSPRIMNEKDPKIRFKYINQVLKVDYFCEVTGKQQNFGILFRLKIGFK